MGRHTCLVGCSWESCSLRGSVLGSQVGEKVTILRMKSDLHSQTGFEHFFKYMVGIYSSLKCPDFSLGPEMSMLCKQPDGTFFFFFLNSAHLEYLPCVAPEQWWPQAMKRQLETSFEHDAGSANTLYPGKCLNLENSHWAVRHKCYIVATLLISWPLIFLIICSSREICWSQNFHYTRSIFLLFSIIFMCFCVGK